MRLCDPSIQQLSWVNAFQLVDLLCCFCVTLPIWTHINFLEKQSVMQVQGKEAINLAKLRQFRSFYLLVFCYIFATRIIVALLVHDTVGFRYTYLTHVGREAAAFIFYVVIGYTFRPKKQSRYLELPARDGEYDDDDDLRFTVTGNIAGAGDSDDEDPFGEDAYFFNADDEQDYGLGEGDGRPPAASGPRKVATGMANV